MSENSYLRHFSALQDLLSTVWPEISKNSYSYRVFTLFDRFTTYYNRFMT